MQDQNNRAVGGRIQERVVQIQIDWIRNSDFSREARVLYPLLQSYADWKPCNGWWVGVRPGMRRLMKDLHCGSVVIRRALEELELAGWVCFQRAGTNHYQLRQMPCDSENHFVQTPVRFLRNGQNIGPKLTYLAINSFDRWGQYGDGAFPRRRQLQDILGQMHGIVGETVPCSASAVRKWERLLINAGLLHITDYGQYVLYDQVEHAREYQWNYDGEWDEV